MVTIGTFDGVHTGHLQIIDQLKQEAALINGETVIVTFDPHPRKIVSQHDPVYLLTTIREKTDLLRQHGIDHIVVVPFTEAFAAQTADAYILDFLTACIHPHTIIIGYDHHFGKNREGNFTMLERYSTQCGFVVKEIPAKVLNASAISSTQIRNAITSGNVETANTLLGYPYFFEGITVKGKQLGRTLGYPTANIATDDAEKLIPAPGVYAVLVTLPDDTVKKGVMSIGYRPTIEEKGQQSIEVNIFDFNADLYGKILRIAVVAFIRAEEKFDGLPALIEAMDRDKAIAIEKLSQC